MLWLKSIAVFIKQKKSQIKTWSWTSRNLAKAEKANIEFPSMSGVKKIRHQLRHQQWSWKNIPKTKNKCLVLKAAIKEHQSNSSADHSVCKSLSLDWKRIPKWRHHSFDSAPFSLSRLKNIDDLALHGIICFTFILFLDIILPQ